MYLLHSEFRDAEEKEKEKVKKTKQNYLTRKMWKNEAYTGTCVKTPVWPRQHGTVVERRPMNQEVMV